MCTSFIFGGLEGKSLLIFAKQGARFFSECFAKIFGHRSKTVHRTVFSLRSIPLILSNEKITREHSKEHSLIIFWWTRGEVALEFCEAGSKNGEVMPRKILRSPFKNSPLDCFFTSFDSPHIISRKNKRGTLDVYLFYFWWTRGEVALDFCKARSKIF